MDGASLLPQSPSGDGEADLDPLRCRTFRQIAELLGRLRLADGSTPYRGVAARVNQLRRDRRIRGKVAVATVHECFNTGRKRMDRDLVLEIAQVLGMSHEGLVRLESALLIAAERAQESDRADALKGLPPVVEVFVGRHAELAKALRVIDEAVELGRGVSVGVTGPAGVGKSQFALQLAMRASRTGWLQLWADFHGFDTAQEPTEAEAVLAGFLRLTGCSRTQLSGLGSTTAKAERLRANLAGRPVAFVLDNVAGSGDVAPLFPLAPGQLAVIASRDRSAVGTADVVIELDGLSPQHGVQVLQRLDPAGRIAADPTAAARLARLCRGIPYELVNLGGQLSDPQMQEWTLIDHEVRLRRLNADETIRPALTASYQSLPDNTRRLFRLLAALPAGTFTAYEAAVLLNEPLPEAERSVQLLHRRHLLWNTGGRKYRYHDITRAFACWLLDRHESASAVERALTRLRDTATRDLDIDHRAP